MLKKILRSILFVGVLLILLIPLGLLLEPKNNTEEAGMYKASANAIRSQKKDSIQVLFLGDSEAYSGFVPLELWNSTGIPSFVCSSLDQKMYETWELLQMAFEYQSPKVVVLETNVLYRVYPSTDTIVPTLERYLPAVRSTGHTAGRNQVAVISGPYSLHRRDSAASAVYWNYGFITGISFQHP